MSSSGRDKARDHQRALRAFAESEIQSDTDDGDDGLDIIQSSRKGLNLSQYVDGQS